MAWDASFEAEPNNDTSPVIIDDSVREVKTNVRAVVGDEHEFDLAETGRQGEHKAGSAKAYHQSDETEPTTRPGGAALSADDAGRLNVVTNAELGGREMDVWDGSDWEPVEPGPMTGAIAMFAADPNVGLRATRWVLCDGSAVSGVTYPALYYHLTGGGGGNAYLPDLRGQFVRGAPSDGLRDPDPTAASAGDRYDVQDDAIAEHDHEVEGATAEVAAMSHTVNDPGHIHGVQARTATVGSGGLSARSAEGPPYDADLITVSQTTGITVDDHAAHSHDLAGTGAKAGTTEASTSEFDDETRPQNVALLFYMHV